MGWSKCSTREEAGGSPAVFLVNACLEHANDGREDVLHLFSEPTLTVDLETGWEVFYQPADKRKCRGNSRLGTRSAVSHRATAFNYSAHLAALGCPSPCRASTAACLRGDGVGIDQAENRLFWFF